MNQNLVALINITTAFNYHSQSPIIFLINTILNGLQFPPVNLYTRTIQYLPFKHNIPQYRPHLLATRDCNHAACDFPSHAKGNYQCTKYVQSVICCTNVRANVWARPDSWNNLSKTAKD